MHMKFTGCKICWLPSISLVSCLELCMLSCLGERVCLLYCSWLDVFHVTSPCWTCTMLFHGSRPRDQRVLWNLSAFTRTERFSAAGKHHQLLYTCGNCLAFLCMCKDINWVNWEIFEDYQSMMIGFLAESHSWCQVSGLISLRAKRFPCGFGYITLTWGDCRKVG